MDFYRIKERSTKNGVLEIGPDFLIRRSKDLMIRGKQFYSIWDEEAGLWSTDEYDVQRLIDQDLIAHKEKTKNEGSIQLKLLSDFSTNSWLQFRNYIGHLSDSYQQLDKKLTFSNTEVKKSDYVSKRLPYPLAPGDISAYEEIISTIYDPEERAKIEWAIGAIVSGDSKKIQKFLVLYGAPGSGKGTILDIVMKLFEGYYDTFEAKTLTGSGTFAMEAFKNNPLVAIDPDGDLSQISDNTRLNALVSHEPMTINEKFKSVYTETINAMLWVATNHPVKFTDAKSGLIRRMIDIRPSGRKIEEHRYLLLTRQVKFELGAIAHHCLEVYREMGRDYYSGYKAVEMMLQTDVFFNFIEAHYDLFKAQDGVSLQQAYELYKVFCEESGLAFKMPKYKLREELKEYFDGYEDRTMVNGERVRSWYSGFNANHFKSPVADKEDKKVFSLILDETESLLDEEYAYMPAQYSKKDGTPQKYWTDKPKMRNGKEYIPKPEEVVSTTLRELDTTREHYVKPPLNHIVIDFDLTDSDGKKSQERNLEVASTWPATYAEFSKSGAGIHLHYIWDGDPTELSRVVDDGIEVKVFTGDTSLRRRLTRCNNVPIASINSGLQKVEKKVINAEAVKSEKAIRSLIDRNLRKEIHDSTKPSMDFISKILEDAYNSGLVYDVSDYRPKLMAFANNSTNQAEACLKIFMNLKLKSEDIVAAVAEATKKNENDDNIVFFDCEVFPNLFIVCWKYRGDDKIVRMINPSPQAIEELFNMKLVGFNVRRYDNHILYGRFLGYNNEELYQLSQKIISGSPNALFREAYNISYADIYEFASKKQGLKKWQIELNLKHDELGLPWDQPVPENMWDRVAEYCDNDVISTEEVFENREQDFVARQILAELSGLSVNDTTQKHTAKIVFGDDKDAQKKFIYTDLSEMFPGYKYEMGKSTYLGEEVGEGGLVRGKPGIYHNVALLDVQSMHPTSIKQLDLFGPYTDNFWGLVQARLAIKGEDYEAASKMLGGKLAPYLDNKENAEALSYALKIVVNIVYGMTSATYDNPFRDVRNKDNIVAKRGALFMVDLKNYIESEGFVVIHVKTDSVKIADATPEIIEKVMAFGRKYGYVFEHEKTFSKIFLANDAVYVAKIGWAPNPKKIGTWDTVGTQFQHRYVKKKLFTHEPLVFRDKCEEKHVTTALYLDFESVIPMVDLAPGHEGELMKYVGKGGLFCPIKPNKGGALLMRKKDDKYYAATGTKGYFWLEADMVETLGREEDIDTSYFDELVDEAVQAIAKFGDVEAFLDQ